MFFFVFVSFVLIISSSIRNIILLLPLPKSRVSSVSRRLIVLLLYDVIFVFIVLPVIILGIVVTIIVVILVNLFVFGCI